MGPTPTATRKTSCARKALPAKSMGSQASSLGFGGQSSTAQPRRGRPGTRRAGAAENRERMTRRAPRKRVEERELLRTIEEEEKVEEKLEISFEVLRASEEEEGAPGELGYPRNWGGAVLPSCSPKQLLSPLLPPVPGTKCLCPSLQAGDGCLGAGRRAQMWSTRSCSKRPVRTSWQRGGRAAGTPCAWRGPSPPPCPWLVVSTWPRVGGEVLVLGSCRGGNLKLSLSVKSVAPLQKHILKWVKPTVGAEGKRTEEEEGLLPGAGRRSFQTRSSRSTSFLC